MAVAFPQKDTAQHWFVLNFIKQTLSKAETPVAVVENFNRTARTDIAIFAPTVVLMEVRNGKVVEKERPLTFHYVFVRDSLENVKKLCAQQNGFSFMLSHGSRSRYGIVPDYAMESFRIIAGACKNSLPFYNIENINLEEGDYIEIIGGEFNGLKGTFMPKEKSKNGNIVIAVSPELGAVLWNVSPSHIRILEFSKNSKRPYDQIEAFIPKLYSALRKFHSGIPLSEKEATTLSIFCRRMECTCLNNHKLEAKLSALLICANTITGDKERAQEAAARFEKYKNSVTNPWTQALISLLLSVSSGNISALPSLLSLHKTEPASKAQSLLLAEYDHYLKNLPTDFSCKTDC